MRSSFSMCRSVVFPALSRPRNTSLPFLLARPEEGARACAHGAGGKARLRASARGYVVGLGTRQLPFGGYHGVCDTQAQRRRVARKEATLSSRTRGAANTVTVVHAATFTTAWLAARSA